MKVSKNGAKGFTSFTINITIESEEEARAMYAIFNHTGNTKLLSGKAHLITNAIGSQYYVVRAGEIISNGITPEVFYL